MRSWSLLLSLCLFLPFLTALHAEDAPLPAGLTDAEREYIRSHRQHWIQGMRSRDARKPENILCAPAEFDPVDGICFSYMSYTTLLRQLIKEVAKDAKAYVAVSDWSYDRARRELEDHGVNMDNVVFERVSLNSVWMRDYGPYWIHTTDGDREILDLRYNRPRPSDDKFPTYLGRAHDWTVHACNLIMPGGNMILDGHGVAIMTDVVFDPSEGGDPNLTVAELEKYMKDYFGCHKVIILKKLLRDGTGHVDIFCKLLNDTTLVVGQYEKPSDGAGDNYDRMNEAAERLANETNGLGQPFRVFRIPMPAYTGTTYTHTNSTIVNDKILVPIYGRGTDDAALEVYRKAMPGTKVFGYDCNRIIPANGAIHCITKAVYSDPLKIEHVEPAPRAGEPLRIEATVSAQAALDPTKCFVHYRTGDGAFRTTPLTVTSDVNGTLTAELPASTAGEKIEYFIRVEDVRGMYETSPEDAGAETVHALTVH